MSNDNPKFKEVKLKNGCTISYVDYPAFDEPYFLKKKFEEDCEEAFRKLVKYTEYVGTELIDEMLKEGTLDMNKHFQIKLLSGHAGIEVSEAKVNIEYNHD